MRNMKKNSMSRLLGVVLTMALLLGNMPGVTTYVKADTVEDSSSRDANEVFRYQEMEEGIKLTGYLGSEENLQIPEQINGLTVKSITSDAFKDCKSLVSVTIPEGVTTIGNGAFFNCRNLKTVAIPSTVTELTKGMFDYCVSLSEINIADANTTYISVDGIVFSKDHTKIVFYPNGREGEYTIPDTVTSIEAEAFSDCNGITSIHIPEGVTSIGNQAFAYSNLSEISMSASVKTIGYSVFSGCDNLTEILISSGVTSIGEYAFYGCDNLTAINVSADNQTYASVNGVLYNKAKTKLILYPGGKEGDYTIPGTVTSIANIAFSNCTSLTGVTMPASVKSIGQGAFMGCSNLKSVIVTSGVTAIGESTFNGCSNLTSVTLPSTIRSIGPFAFCKCSNLIDITIPANVTSIGDSAFSYCEAIEKVVIPKGAAVGYNAFYYCSSLKSVTLPEDIQTIKSYTFKGCSSLTDIIIPDTVTAIEFQAFQDCSSLSSITLPSQVSSLGGGRGDSVTISPSGEIKVARPVAFSGCTSLTEINVSEENETYTAVDGVLFNKEKTKIIVYPAGKPGKYEIPEGVTEFQKKAFEGCVNLTEITFPASVTSINSEIFESCTALTSVIVPEWITNVDYNSFSECSNLAEINVATENPNYASLDGVLFNKEKTELILCPEGKEGEYVIPDGVSSIKNYAFKNCNKLNSVIIPNTITQITQQTFYKCSKLESITIPASVTSIGSYAFGYLLNEVYIEWSKTDIQPTIRCYEGSEAHNYAVTYDYAYILLTELTDDMVTVQEKAAYTGKEIVPEIVVKDGDTALQMGEDYEISLQNNIDVGTATVVIRGKGRYDGVITRSFKIERQTTIEPTKEPGQEITVTPTPEPTIVPTAEPTIIPGQEVTKKPTPTPGQGTAAKQPSPKPSAPASPGNDSLVLKKGTTITDNDTGAVFKVTSASSQNVTVEYVKPISGKGKASTVTIPNVIKKSGKSYKVTSIAANAFKNNRKLKKVIIGKNVVSIGDKAFYKCVKLTKITIPSKVRRIGKQAFDGCKRLNSILIRSKQLTAKSVGSKAFRGIRKTARIKVPAGKVKLYKKVLKSKNTPKRAVDRLSKIG